MIQKYNVASIVKVSKQLCIILMAVTLKIRPLPDVRESKVLNISTISYKD